MTGQNLCKNKTLIRHVSNVLLRRYNLKSNQKHDQYHHCPTLTNK